MSVSERPHLIRKGIFFIIAAVIAARSLYAGEREIMDLAAKYYSGGDYHSCITEALRYESLYPRGSSLAESRLLLGKAYYRGGNYGAALNAVYECHKTYPSSPAGEEARYLLGVMRLDQGSPFYAISSFNQYGSIYKNGRFTEEVRLGLCYAAALYYDPASAREELLKYRKEFPDGKYGAEARDLDDLAARELEKPKKSALAAGLGSAVVPGFGYFYTGNYGTGFLSFFSNALFIFLIYQGYASGNIFQMVFFSFVELSFYQYSIYGGIRSVYEYNRRDEFTKQVKVQIGKTFRF